MEGHNITSYHLLLGEHVSLFSKILSHYLENSGLSLACSKDTTNILQQDETTQSISQQLQILLLFLLINLILLIIQCLRKTLKKKKPFNPFALRLSSSPEDTPDKVHND